MRRFAIFNCDPGEGFEFQANIVTVNMLPSSKYRMYPFGTPLYFCDFQCSSPCTPQELFTKVMIFIGFIQFLTVKSSQIRTTILDLYHHLSGTICNSRIANSLVCGAACVDYPAAFFTFGPGYITFFGEIVNLLLNGGTAYAESR